MTIPKPGEIFRYARTGDLYEVRVVTREFIVLHALDGSSQVMTGKGSLDFLFFRAAPGDSFQEEHPVGPDRRAPGKGMMV